MSPLIEEHKVPDDVPLRMGSIEDFIRVKSALHSAGFDDSRVCQALEIERISDIGKAKLPESNLGDRHTLFLLIRIFLFLESAPVDEVEQLMDQPVLESLLALDLIRRARLKPDDHEIVYYSPVLLSPVAGLLVASDRYKNADGSAFSPPADVVFPPIYAGTVRFLRVIPRTPAQDALDIGSGSGIGALVLCSQITRVVASDITLRASHFARFNALLNGCSNVEILQGDVYSAVEGRTFDHIIAHPPYVPSIVKTQIYRDAGETGEALVTRIVQGLPKHLRPGGTYFSVCAGWDTKAAPFEQRVRTWLGESARDFEIIFAVSGEKPAGEVAKQLAERSSDNDPSLRDRWNQTFSQMERLVYGALIISRRECEDEGQGGEPLVMRARLGSGTDGSDFEWILRWRRWRSKSHIRRLIADLRPELGLSLRVRVTHVVDGGSLLPAHFVLESERPFPAETKVDPWIATLLQEFVGESTVAEIYERLRNKSAIPEELDLADFTDLVGLMIERGYLRIDQSVFSG